MDLKNNYCLTTSNYFINQNMLNIKTILKWFKRPIICFTNQTAVTFVVGCMLYQSTYLNTTLTCIGQYTETVDTELYVLGQ